MKKVITLSTVLLCGLCLAACNTSKNTNAEKAETTSVQETKVQETTDATTTAPIKDTQWIGSDDYGYVKIPKLWVHFKEIEGGDDIQYCDGTDVNIVTLNTFKLEQFGISESEYAALETVQISTSIY